MKIRHFISFYVKVKFLSGKSFLVLSITATASIFVLLNFELHLLKDVILN